jgi:uncharacterized protein
MSKDWNHVQKNGWECDNVKILSIDGGGIRGIFAARYLAKIEQDLGSPINESFDLITGTSTGGIIAIATSLGIPAKEIEALYAENGNIIFKPKNRILSRLNLDCIFSCKYDSGELKRLLVSTLGDSKMSDAQTFLCIPAVEHNKAKPKVFKTPHNSQLHIDANISVVDIALSTAAAPTYLKAHSISGHDCKLDGGLWANNPVLIGIAESVKNGVSLNKIKILSIGTGETFYNSTNNRAFNGGLIRWNKKLVDVMLNVQSEGALQIAKYLIGDNLKRINFTPTRSLSLDSVKKTDIDFMKQEADTVFAKTYKNDQNIYNSFFV